jgi:hypothetical protein
MMNKRPIADAGLICPLHKKDTSKVCHTCPWYIQLRGKNPQSNTEIDEWGCAISWLPILTIETAQRANQTAAAVESFRNTMVEQRNELLELEKQRTSNPLLS